MTFCMYNCIFYFSSWIFGLIIQGWKKDLEKEDVYDVLEEHRSERLGERLQR